MGTARAWAPHDLHSKPQFRRVEEASAEGYPPPRSTPRAHAHPRAHGGATWPWEWNAHNTQPHRGSGAATKTRTTPIQPASPQPHASLPLNMVTRPPPPHVGWQHTHTHTHSEWPACLKLCVILPDKTVRVSGMGEYARWRRRCLELGRVSRHRCQRPLEDVDDQLREEVQLVEAGMTWAEQDAHPWELFICKLHEMFLRVLKARKQREDESGLMFPTHFRKEPRNTYPWHQI